MYTPSQTAICTWFVADTSDHATYFPQVSGRSDDKEVQAVYWRCIVCFFASSLLLNPDRSHVLFTNCNLPKIGDLDLTSTFDAWGVQTIQLPITYRLPQGTVGRWGNQFYILDVLRYLAEQRFCERAIVLDSDCLWMKNVENLERAIEDHGVLTYTLGIANYKLDEPINGVTRQQLAEFLERQTGVKTDLVAYHGGEILAANIAELERMAGQIDPLWDATLQGSPGAPKEEAHFLSLLYAINGYKHYTANPYIKRIWTNLTFNNCSIEDLDLTIWHLPAEKKSGFRDLYNLISRNADVGGLRSLRLGVREYGRMMGVPRRSLKKLVRDGSAKLVEHAITRPTARVTS